MHPTRREFFQVVAAAGAASMVPWRRVSAYTTLGRPGGGFPGIGKFQTVLRGIGPGGIPVAVSDGSVSHRGIVAAHYSLNISEFTDQLHPGLGATHLWGFSPSRAFGEGPYPTRHLGGIIVARKGVPVQLTVTNTLPPDHILPVDTSIPSIGGFVDALGRYGGSGHNAVCTHLHGGFVPWVSDGGPYAWYTPSGNSGQSFMFNFMKQTLNSALRAGQAEYYYPNAQSARMMWYHDHAHDITRLNAYAGIATAYIIRDAAEDNLLNRGLPNYVEAGGNEIPLVIQDKVFVGSDIATLDPAWTAVTTPKSQSVGSLWYPHVYSKKDFRFKGHTVMPEPSCVPEMFGDTMVVNGTVIPGATVEARRYRFRMLNACQARFLNVQLYEADASPDGITYNSKGVPVNTSGPDFLVIGTEGGFLPAPVTVPATQPFNPGLLSGAGPNMLMAPAERLDFIVDFAGRAGKSFILYTDAPAPFPFGGRDTDFYSGNVNRLTRPGYAPDTRIMMKFNVVTASSSDPSLRITGASLRAGVDPFIVPPGVAVQNGAVNLPPGTPVRQLTLNEAFDSLGRLIQLLGTNDLIATIPGSYGKSYDTPSTENVTAGSTEVWQIANLTGDTHPIHFHLVNVQVLARQPFNVRNYAGAPIYTGPARSPDPTELGWKETVRMNPGEVTTVVMRFDLPSVPFVVPSSPRTGGAEYVWHCHILEHEEHDMMRPLVVI